MHTITIMGHEFGIELWCRLTDFNNWQLGQENDAGGWRGWLGPLHVAACKIKVAR